jgi:hypothetical protein
MSKRLIFRTLLLSAVAIAGGVAVSEAFPVQQVATAAAAIPASGYALATLSAGFAGMMRLGRSRG